MANILHSMLACTNDIIIDIPKVCHIIFMGQLFMKFLLAFFSNSIVNLY